METRKQVIAKIVDEFPGGRDAAAAFLGMTVSTFNNHQYELKTRPFYDSEIEALERVSETNFYAQYIANMYGGLFVQQQEKTELDHVTIERLLMKLCTEYGQMHITIQDATADGVIDRQEERDLNAKRDNLIRAIHEFVDATKSLYQK